MKILSADDRLLFREKVRNKQIGGELHVAGHVTEPVVLIGASHG